MDIPKCVQAFLNRLVEEYPIEELLVFGSRAVGDHEPRSDFDIGVRAASIERCHFSRLRVEAAEARTMFWISLVHLDSTPDKLKQRIQEQGVRVYERKKASGEPFEP